MAKSFSRNLIVIVAGFAAFLGGCASDSKSTDSSSPPADTGNKTDTSSENESEDTGFDTEVEPPDTGNGDYMFRWDFKDGMDGFMGELTEPVGGGTDIDALLDTRYSHNAEEGTVELDGEVAPGGQAMFQQVFNGGDGTDWTGAESVVVTIRMVEPGFGGLMFFVKSDTRAWEEPDAGPDAGPASSGQAWNWLGNWIDFPTDNQWVSYELTLDSTNVNIHKVQAVGVSFVAGDWIAESQNLHFAIDSFTVY